MCGRALAPRRRRAGERAGLRCSAGAGCCAHLHRLAPFRPAMMPTLSTPYRVARFFLGDPPAHHAADPHPLHSTTRSPIPQRHRRENPHSPAGPCVPPAACASVSFSNPLAVSRLVESRPGQGQLPAALVDSGWHCCSGGRLRASLCSAAPAAVQATYSGDLFTRTE